MLKLFLKIFLRCGHGSLAHCKCGPTQRRRNQICAVGRDEPKFVDEEFIFDLTRFDPKNIKFVLKSKRITLVDYENSHDYVAEGI